MATENPEVGPYGVWLRLKPVALTGAGMFFSQVIGVGLGVFSARLLGPATKGQLAAVTTWAQILIWVSTFGLNTAIAVRVAETFAKPSGRGDLESALGNSLVYSLTIGSSIAVVAFVLLRHILSHLGAGTELLLILALAGIPLGVIITILMSLQISIGRRSRLAVAQVTGPLLTVVCLAILYLSGGRLTAAYVVLAGLLSTIGLLVLLAWGLPWGSLALDRRRLFADCKFGASTAVGGVFTLVNLRLDILIMSVIVSTNSLGFYSAANNVMGPLVIAPLAASAHLTPRVANRGPGRGTTQFIFHEALLYSGITLLIGVALAIAAPVMIPLLLGAAYKPAVVLIWLLIPGFIARAFSAVAVAGANGQRRARVGNLAEGAAAIVTVAALPFAIRLYGVTGAAVVSTIAYAVSAVVAALMLRHETTLPSNLARARDMDAGP